MTYSTPNCLKWILGTSPTFHNLLKRDNTAHTFWRATLYYVARAWRKINSLSVNWSVSWSVSLSWLVDYCWVWHRSAFVVSFILMMASLTYINILLWILALWIRTFKRLAEALGSNIALILKNNICSLTLIHCISLPLSL